MYLTASIIIMALILMITYQYHQRYRLSQRVLMIINDHKHATNNILIIVRELRKVFNSVNRYQVISVRQSVNQLDSDTITSLRLLDKEFGANLV